MSLYLEKYDRYKKWIFERREDDFSWDSIKYGLRDSVEGLKEFLKQQKINNNWEISTDEWLRLVDIQKEIEENSYDILDKSSIISTEKEPEKVEAVEIKGSSWLGYKNRLLEKGFAQQSIDSIKESTLKILSRLKQSTVSDSPVRGLVVGNVQSGKTANMAALISMAADAGWNMFIILTGTIENLRQQTEERIHSDLTNSYGNVRYHLLRSLKPSTPYPDRLQDLKIEDNHNKYLYLCLKNSTRLRDLLKWINKDSNKKKHLKILIIDDEADQAGINTADINEEERRTINDLIISLVYNRDHERRKQTVKVFGDYGAMNYIGYTATPYANILNEASEDSLYPHNFIAVLSTSNEYFGPQQIFGMEGTPFEGLPIINNITGLELTTIKRIHNGKKENLPKSFIESLMWFLCCVSISRFWGRKKPMSMLIHTSQKQRDHLNFYKTVKRFFDSKDTYEILALCKEVYSIQTNQFDLEKLRLFYPNYGIADDYIKSFPKFEEILPHLEDLIKINIQHIMMNDDRELEYSNGIHLCVDNCQHNQAKDDGTYLRLVYPDEQTCEIVTPAFIVIGGSTLSRGLTLEGLVSTYFLRSTTQADTLMQMGRWFGYRRGYELLPRIWLSKQTLKQFKFLSILDHELRKEIHEMEINDVTPSEYGPRVSTHPKASFIRVTAKNRMQSAEEVDIDYSGSSHQTVVFYKDKSILQNNLQVTEELIESLGKDDNKNMDAKNCRVFRSVDTDKITKFLSRLRYPEQTLFYDMSSLVTWIENIEEEGYLNKWNVILAGLTSGEEYKFANVSIFKVNRSQLKKTTENDTVNIGVLKGPRDEIADIDLENATEEMYEKYKKLKSNYVEIRKLFNLDKTPQLVIYIIDKDSKVTHNDKAKNREDLEVEEDVVGIWLNIPAKDGENNYSTKLRIKLDNSFDKGDLSE